MHFRFSFNTFFFKLDQKIQIDYWIRSGLLSTPSSIRFCLYTCIQTSVRYIKQSLNYMSNICISVSWYYCHINFIYRLLSMRSFLTKSSRKLNQSKSYVLPCDRLSVLLAVLLFYAAKSRAYRDSIYISKCWFLLKSCYPEC